MLPECWLIGLAYVMEKAMENRALSIADMKKILTDCFAVNPWIYWADFLISAALGWGCFYLTETAETLSWAELFYFTVSVFAFYRAALVVHELTHQERREFPGFSFVWNLLIGIPILVPSFMYRGVHIDHHRKATYGTEEDGEYLPFGASPFWRSLFYLGQSILIPFLLVFRFLVLAPLSLLHPRFRAFVMLHTSALAIRMDTPRRLPAPGSVELRNWYIQETLCFVWCFTLFIGFASGLLELGTLRHIYLLLTATFFVNSIRTVVAHRYRNRTGKEVSFQEQFEDSVNLEGNPLLLELLAPVGLRYHALHHLFPTIPYYNLGVAHRRLRAQLPANSVYHLATEPTLRSALATLWRNTRQAQREEDELARNSSYRV